MMMPFTASVSAAEQMKPFKPNTPSESTMQMKAAVAEQLNLLKGGPKLHKDLQGLSGNEIVDVIIHLSETPVGLQKGINKLAGKEFNAAEQAKVLQKVNAQQTIVKKEMKALQVTFKEGYSFSTVLNGFAAKVKVSDLPKLLEIKGVTLIEPDAVVYAFEESVEDGTEEEATEVETEETEVAETVEVVTPVDGQVDAFMNTSIGFLGIEALWAEGYEGQGIKVAVLDTGIDADHPDFQGIYKGGKNFIPNSSIYTRPRADDDASETSPVERPAGTPEFNANGSSFYTSHGTHVAGTIAAIGNNEYGIKGIAPKIDLYAYRVLGAYGSGATSGIVKAIDTAVEEGMDVINLSLGGGSNTETDAGSFAINNAMLAGTISVIATGNSGPNRGTMGTPSTSRLGIAVGNTTNPELSAVRVKVTNDDFQFSNNVKFFFTPFGKNLKQELSGELDIIAIPGVGKESDYDQLDVKGKVVHVSRGEIAFMDKIHFATEKGAKAIIIYNTKDHADGNDNPMSNVGSGDVFDVAIPSFNMSYNDGKAIKDGLENGEGIITFDVDNFVWTSGDEVNNSSSRGPSTPNFDIKPDVTAPGTNIMSTIPMYKADFPEATYEQAYARKTGTSMATPHIAGIAALIKQVNPTWDAFDVKVALSNTAKILDTGKYDVFAQGAGRVQAYAAAHPEILAYALDTANNDGKIVDNLKGTVTFGNQSLEKDLELTKEILVKDMEGNGGDYDVTVTITKEYGDAKLTIDKPTFSLEGEVLLNVTLTASAANTKPGDEFLGYIHIKGVNAEVSLPFAVNFGPQIPTEVKDMRITRGDLSFNSERTSENAILYFTITGDVGTNYIELWDVMDPFGGVYEDGYIGYLHAGSSLGAGSYQLPIGGQYTPWDGTGATVIPDGVYTIDFSALTKSGNPQVIFDYVGPLFVKSEAPSIEASFNESAITGKVTDKYLDWKKAGFQYDINSKLFASYLISIGNEETQVPFNLTEDGKIDITIDMPKNFDDTTKAVSVKVIVEDAAGNISETVVYRADGQDPDPDEDEITYSVSDDILDLTVGEWKQLFVTETTTKSDGATVEKDVTADATFTSDNENVAIVEGNYVTAVDAGVTHITVTYGDFTEYVTVYVTGHPQTNMHTIEILAGSDERIIKSGNGAVLKKVHEGQHEYSISMDWSSGSEGIHKLTFPTDSIYPKNEYKLIYWIEYEENGETNTYYDEVIVSGDSLLEITELTLPTEGLLKTAIDSEDSGLTFNYVRFLTADSGQWSVNHTNLNVFEGYLVSENPLTLPFVINGEKDDLKHFLTGMVTIGNALDYDALKTDSSKLELEGSYDWGYLNKKGTDVRFHLKEGGNDAIQLSNGTYNISFSNNVEWNGEFVIDGDQTIQIPTEPTKLEFLHFSSNYYNSLWINYGLTLGSGQFRMNSYSPENEIKFEIFYGTQKVFEGFEKYFHSSIDIDASNWKNGTYTVKATYLTTDGKELVAERDFNFNSGIHELKGTVFTAENSEGEILKSGIVTLYEKTSGSGNPNYKRVISKEIKLVAGAYEAFIPDAYILDGMEYYVTVVDYSSKTMYAHEFTGQKNKYHHFNGTDLSELKVNIGSFTTDSVDFRLLGNNVNGVSVYLGDIGWHVASDGDFIVDWIGTDENNEKYKFFGMVTKENDYALDLTNVDWQILKPSSKYENAAISLYSSGETYSKIYVSEEIMGHPTIYLVVKDEKTSYEGYVFYVKGKKEQEVEFNAYHGSAYTSPDSTVVYTYYHNDSGSLYMNGESTFIYEILDENDERIGEPISTPYYSSFTLKEPLKKGTYKIKLIESTVNEEIVSISMDTMIFMDVQQLSLPVEVDTKYGKFHPDQLTIQDDDPNSSHYGSTYVLNWDFQNSEFYLPYGVTLNPDTQYKIMLNGSLSHNNAVMDFQQTSGESLLNISKANPLQLSDDLKAVKVTHNLDVSSNYRAELILGLAVDGYSPFNPVYLSGKDSFEVLVSPENYHGRILVFDNAQNVKILNVPETTISEDFNIEVNGKDLANVTIKNGASNMAISGFEHFPNRYRVYGESGSVSSVSIQKGHYEYLRYYVSTNEKYDTPWSYSIISLDVNIDSDKSFNFKKDEISGEINSLDFWKFEDGTNYLSTFNTLYSGDFIIDGIYRSLESNPNMGIAEAEEDPIRDYRGNFNSNMNRVPVDYKIIDQTGKVVWETTGTMSDRGFHINKEFTEGTYTLEVRIPISLRKSLTLTKEFSVAGENTPFVQIHTPQSGSITNSTSITVIGKANADAEVTLELQKDGEKVNGAVITADAEGAFTHTFQPGTDGVYTIVASNEDAKTSVSVTIDRTPPEKAINIEFAKEASGLKVTWTGAQDAVSYKVEVAESDGEFTVLSESQKETTAVIPNIKPGVTYKVKITSTDAAKNTSVSDVASFTVDAFTATTVTLQDGRNADKLLSIGDGLAVTVDGSYDEGFTAVANVYVDGKVIEVELAYNETSKRYEGVFTVIEGQKVIEKVTGHILNGEEKTEEISTELDWSVGSTVKGLVTDGQPIEDATVRLVSTKLYTVKTDANGAFEIKGLPSGNYKMSVLVNGKTFVQPNLEVAQSKIVAVPEYKIPAFTNASITIVDKGTDNPVIDGLSARLTGPKGFIVFGSTSDGKFTTNNGTTVLKDLETGEYKLTVYGQGTYLTTTASITLAKGTTDYKFEVNKLTIEEKTLTIKINGDVEKIDSIYLYSYSTYQKHGYTGVGNYYKYNVKPENGVIVFENVAAANDYSLDIYAEGFMSVHQNVDMTDNSEIEITLDQGRVITGKVTDSQGKPVSSAYVYAYGGYTGAYAETDANGEYKLIGLSKTDDIWLDVYSQLYLSHQETIVKGTDEVEKDIQLAKAVMMTGKVVDRNGDPLANVSISADGQTTYGWGRTAADGTFAVTGLKDTETYNLSFYSYGYPTVTLEGKQPGNVGEVTLQAKGDGDFDGDGTYLAVSKTSVVPNEEVQFTLVYQNYGTAKAVDVPVTLTLPAGLTLIPGSVTLNGKPAKVEGNIVTIPSAAAGESGKITFSATVGDVETSSLTVTAKVTEKGAILSATTSVVFVTLEAPALTGVKNIKVYGNAKYGSKVELFAGNKKVGETKVDGKWWFIDVELPVTDAAVEEKFTLSAKVTDGVQATVSKQPVTVTYKPNVPKMTDVTVHAGWNGDVKLNPYTGVATFAIVEHTPLDTTVKFDMDVDSAKISFLGKEYDLVKGADNTFTFDGQKLGKWTSYGEQLLEITFIKDDVEITLPLMNIIVLIDPSGYVFEGSMDNRLEGVRAVVEVLVGEGEDAEWVQWDAAKFGQVNPQITDEEGRYGWDVTAGKWRVIFTKDGYEPYISRIMNVPPPETELNVPMVRIADPVITTTEVTAIDLTVEFDRLMNTADKSTLIQLFEGDSDTPIEGTVETVDLTGYKSIDTPEDKKAGHIGKDNNEEDGFFVEDDTKKLSKTFKFVPKSSLKANTTYRLVVSGNIEDSSGKILGAVKEFTFTTEKTDNGGAPGDGGGGVYIPPAQPVDPKPEKPELIIPVFKDIKNTFAAKEINALAAKGIIQGKTETEFAPNAQITRAEFAVLLARALDLPLKEYEGKFSDVNKSKKWAYAGVEAAARAGIVNGTQDGKFNPDAPIKREEIAAMIMRAILYQDKAKLEGIELPAHFNDHGSIGAFAIESVYKAAAIGVIKGNNGNFMPKNNATRAESAVMLYRALDVLQLLD
ncbi:S8 family serine peptidase [Sporosarcina sp. F6_3S_P_2]|uniref:S8 family serine peptidase n=2 Tax=Sporosarcina highlanderae TaxID=3035916 RepID=A0ABT8JLC6_9BACL|nr:S8 family serine peptidase [Sporosarcina highlanderae]MDN4605946.1 S8 family serine peptidase [Sporosarcina highlanderae]